MRKGKRKKKRRRKRKKRKKSPPYNPAQWRRKRMRKSNQAFDVPSTLSAPLGPAMSSKTMRRTMKTTTTTSPLVGADVWHAPNPSATVVRKMTENRKPDRTPTMIFSHHQWPPQPLPKKPHQISPKTKTTRPPRHRKPTILKARTTPPRKKRTPMPLWTSMRMLLNPQPPPSMVRPHPYLWPPPPPLLPHL